MESTPDEAQKKALQKGIEAHKAGQIREAFRLYKEVLQAIPKHPLANHNLGLVAVSLGKNKEALQFFKVALDANPSIGYFWLSYMGVLIKTDRIADARSLLDQAKEKGVKGEFVDKMEQCLYELTTSEPNSNSGEGSLDRQNPPQEQLELIIQAYKQGLMEQALAMAHQQLEKHPNSETLYNFLGTINAELGKFEEAISSYKKILQFKPNNADAYNNMGSALKAKGDLAEAINSYKQALKIRPDYADAHNNLGISFEEKGDHSAAINSYKQALKLMPHNANIFDNIGIALQNGGDIAGAISSYKKALKIRPNHVQAAISLQLIEAQTLESHLNVLEPISKDTASLHKLLSEDPRYQICQSISNFIKGDLNSTKECLSNYNDLSNSSKPESLTEKGKVFCNAYYRFISYLIARNQFDINSKHRRIYHIGESHCLSYAHCSLVKGKETYTISPRLTIGAKAYHFSTQAENKFTAVTKHNLSTMPNGSTVFISVGEIDCRANEGIILASEKTGGNLEKLVYATVLGFVSWFQNENLSNRHSYFFFNVPAPRYNKKFAKDINAEVAEVVALFNSALKNILLECSVGMIDVYEHTMDENGFSNELYHCDKQHLDSRILGLIQEQWNGC
jgi:tetratricopeptide (TPR) repeat protein